MLLKTEKIFAGYGNVKVLRDISIEIDNGEAVAILGANGSGKTTLIKALVSLVKVDQGMIEFDSERIDQLPSYKVVQRGISVCPEGGGCYPHMSTLKNLMMGTMLLRDRSKISDVYENIIELFPILDKRKKQRAGSLSGGERQMLAIGRALMGMPKLLLMDEPSLGLAPIIINRIFEAIETLKEQGLTILLVEQNASKSLKIADRGYVMELGEIVLSGTSTDLSKNDTVRKAYFGM
jgi:branched-chain amino acid transport system ATP-binding protein